MTGCRLHLIHPLGFEITDRHLRRAGMDYWKSLDVLEHASWAEFLRCADTPQRLWLFTTKAAVRHWDVSFADGDGLVFGCETQGAPDWLHADLHERRVCIYQPVTGLRSLNLSTAVGIGTYEALRQVLRS